MSRPRVPANKSTNVRTTSARSRPDGAAAAPASMAERALRGAFTLLRPFPDASARLAEQVFCAPPRPRLRAGDGMLDCAERTVERVAGHDLAVWSWGEGPRVVLLHGWGGRGAQLTAFVAPLLARGYSVSAFDAPAHGESSGRLSSMVDFARALLGLAERKGPLHGVVAHSLGGAAATLALQQGLALDRAVFVGPPADPLDWVFEFAARLHLRTEVVDAMRERIERRLGTRWSDLDVLAMARQMAGVSLLVVHDRDDGEVQWSDGAALAAAWPGARLVSTSRLGHRRVLRDARVVATAAAFLAGEPLPEETLGCAHRAEPFSAIRCEACAMEHDLFRPRARVLLPVRVAAALQAPRPGG